MGDNEYSKVLEREKANQGNQFEKAVLEELRIIREHLIDLKKKVDVVNKKPVA